MSEPVKFPVGTTCRQCHELATHRYSGAPFCKEHWGVVCRLARKMDKLVGDAGSGWLNDPKVCREFDRLSDAMGWKDSA